MLLNRKKEELCKLVNHQLYNLFGEKEDISNYLDSALERLEICFSPYNNKYFKTKHGETFFSPLNTDQYAIFLYILSNDIYKESKNTDLATKLYYLNKVMNSVDLYYELDLPNYWGVVHPIGSVLGRATYSNGFIFYQGCTVGVNKGKQPKLGNNVIMYANSIILGASNIGNNVVISVGSVVVDEIIPDNSLVFGKSPDLLIKPKDEKYLNNIINNFWIK